MNLLGIASRTDGAVAGLRPLPAIRTARADRLTTPRVGMLLLVLGLVVLVAATGPFPTGSSTAVVNASGPTTAGAYASAEAPVYEARPTCERGPGEVAELTTDAVRGPRLGSGLVVMGRFWNPDHVLVAPRGVWSDMIQTDDRITYYESRSVRFEGPAIDGDTATVRAIAVIDEDGTEAEYVYQFSRRAESPRAGCWVIDRFGPAGEDSA